MRINTFFDLSKNVLILISTVATLRTSIMEKWRPSPDPTEETPMSIQTRANALIMAALFVAGCGPTETNNQEIDCGQGDAIEHGDQTYCVYEAELLIENGFLCPAGLVSSGTFGPVGVCAPRGVGTGTLVDIYKKHRDMHMLAWSDSECIEAAECDGGSTCDDAACVAPPITEPACKDGETEVADSSACLQDDAICYENANGTWCTGPDAPTPSCQDGETEVADSSMCLQDDAICYENDNGTWCTAPAG